MTMITRRLFLGLGLLAGTRLFGGSKPLPRLLQFKGPVAQEIYYCCSNHSPPHCVSEAEMADYEKKYQCTGWKAKSWNDTGIPH